MSNKEEQLEEMKKAVKDAVKANLDSLVEGNIKKKGYKKDESDDSESDDDSLEEEDKKNKSNDEEENPCWDGYVQYGMKTKNGKKVPNCVKESDLTEEMKKDMAKMNKDMEDMDDEDMDDMDDEDMDKKKKS